MDTFLWRQTYDEILKIATKACKSTLQDLALMIGYTIDEGVNMWICLDFDSDWKSSEPY